MTFTGYRRLRAGKTNVALQTDFIPTKVMKEAVTGVQDDMILFKDIGILTDGQYSIKKDNNQQCISTKWKIIPLRLTRNSFRCINLFHIANDRPCRQNRCLNTNAFTQSI